MGFMVSGWVVCPCATTQIKKTPPPNTNTRYHRPTTPAHRALRFPLCKRGTEGDLKCAALSPPAVNPPYPPFSKGVSPLTAFLMQREKGETAYLSNQATVLKYRNPPSTTAENRQSGNKLRMPASRFHRIHALP